MGSYVTIRERCAVDLEGWLGMRRRLWPDIGPELLKAEQVSILANAPRNSVLVAATGEGELVGFVEVSLREWAEGCRTHPVGYVEAWYVEPPFRRTGVGRRLIEAAESWAKKRGCTEMASDADLDNHVSHSAHRALAYSEIGRAVLFAKKLTPG